MSDGRKRIVRHRKIAARLLGAGVEPRIVSETLDIPLPETLRIAPTAAEVAWGDAEIRNAVRGLVAKTINRAEYLLRYGAPSIQIRLIDSMVRPLLRSAREAETEEEKLVAVREAFERLMEGVDQHGQATAQTPELRPARLLAVDGIAESEGAAPQ